MKLAVSNIAWSAEEEPEALQMLRALQVDALEIAPGRWWPDPARTTPAEIAARRLTLGEAGFSIAAFQAILFGRADLQLFGTDESRAALQDWLGHVARLAAACGAKPIVFGAPKNRLRPPGLSEEDAEDLAVAFFSEAAAVAAALGVYFTLEPNPTAYGCNFATDLASAARVVRRVGSPGLRLQIDAGELALNEAEVECAVLAHRDLIGHVHVSQASLADFREPWPGHARLAAALAEIGYSGFASIEMKRSDAGLAAVAEAVETVRACYGAL